jgi:hypothetical protein
MEKPGGRAPTVCRCEAVQAVCESHCDGQTHPHGAARGHIGRAAATTIHVEEQRGAAAAARTTGRSTHVRCDASVRMRLMGLRIHGK